MNQQLEQTLLEAARAVARSGRTFVECRGGDQKTEVGFSSTKDDVGPKVEVVGDSLSIRRTPLCQYSDSEDDEDSSQTSRVVRYCSPPEEESRTSKDFQNSSDALQRKVKLTSTRPEKTRNTSSTHYSHKTHTRGVGKKRTDTWINSGWNRTSWFIAINAQGRGLSGVRNLLLGPTIEFKTVPH